MTTQEFSDQFDLLFNNISSNQAPGLSEYEKSVFLTKAQDEIIKNHFLANSTGNSLKQGFDDNAKRQIDFSMLMVTTAASRVSGTSIQTIYSGNNTAFYVMPSDVMLYINEVVTVARDNSSKNLTVIPLSFEEYNRLMSKPYKRPLKNQAWRLISAATNVTVVDYDSIATVLAGLTDATATKDAFLTSISGKSLDVVEVTSPYTHDALKVGSYLIRANATLIPPSVPDSLDVTSIKATLESFIDNPSRVSGQNIVELIPGPNDTISNYIIRYVKRPVPIVLEDFTADDLRINGVSIRTECELDPILHEEILQRAVELAKIAWQGDVAATTQSGQRSE